ncbi:stAR-related lipid transfer protein 9 isoform X2 [Eleutherodactylus coqui]
MEQYNVDINEGKARVTIDSGLPHLIAMNDDILSTGVVIYYLREGTTNVGSGDHDIVLQGENIQQEHCVIENKFGVVELRPSFGALCTVNGQEVKDTYRLSQGAIIVLGKSHRLRFNHPAEAAVLRQMRSDSRVSFVNDCTLDWLDLSGDFSSSSKGNSLILNTSDSEPPSEEYQRGLRELEATCRKQIEDQRQYVEGLKSEIQAAQVKGEKELELEQSLINKQIQENQQWLIIEKERLSALCHQKQESSSQTEPKTYVEVEVQNCVQTDVQPTLEEQEGKKLVQLELLRKCSLRRAERNIRRKRVKFQLERIVKKQKLLEAKKTLHQLQAACWLSDDIVKSTLHVPKVQENSVNFTDLHRSSSSPSGFSFYRRCSLPWSSQTLPNPHSAVLKRKSELAHTTKTNEVRNPLRSVSIDCLLNPSANPDNNGQLESKPYSINTKNLQFVEEHKIDLLLKQISANTAFLSSDPQMSKKRQKMDKPKAVSKGSSNNFTAEQPKRRNMQATVSTGTKDTKLKPLKSPSPVTIGGPKKCAAQEKSKISPKSDVGKLPPYKSAKHAQISPGQGKPSFGEPTVKSKPARYNMASFKSNIQRKPAEQPNKSLSSVDNISKKSSRPGENQTSDRSRIGTERLTRALLKTSVPTLGDCKKNDHTDSSDSESFYSIDSLSSAYASALTEQLKQEELQRQRSNIGQKDSDSEDSQMSQDSLAEKDKRKERPNKRRFSKYKTISAASTTPASFTEDHNTFPLLTTGSVTTGLIRSFSLDSLADAEDALESSEELPAEIFWKLQSPRNLILNEEDQDKENIAAAAAVREDSSLDLRNSFYLKVNDGPVPNYSDVAFHGKTEHCPPTLSNICDGLSQTISLACDSASSSSGLSNPIDTLKSNGNIVHSDALSEACAPTLESPVRENEMNHLCTNVTISKSETDPFQSQLEVPHIKSAQYSHTETQDEPSNKSTLKGSETVQEDNAHEYCLPDCNSLDKRCSTDLIDAPGKGQNNSLNIQEPLSDLSTCKSRTLFSESKDSIATSLEMPINCSKNVSSRKKIQGDEQLNTKISNAPIASINGNELDKKSCSEELCKISLVDQVISEGIDMLRLPLSQENVYLNNTTGKHICENTNYAMPMPLQAHVVNLNNQQQHLSTICEESVMFGPLCCESIQKEPKICDFKENNGLIYSTSNAVQLLSQSQKCKVECDVNANTDFNTEKQTNPVEETKHISNYDNEQCSVEKQDGCEYAKSFSTGNTNGRQVNRNLLGLENKTPCPSTKVSLPVQNTSFPLHRIILLDSCFPTSEQGNVLDNSLHAEPEPCFDETKTFVKPRQLTQSLCHTSEKAAMMAINPSPVPNHVLSDNCINVAIQHDGLKHGEGLCSTTKDDSTVAKNCLIRPPSQDLDESDDATQIKNSKERICPLNEGMLPENKRFSKSYGESAKTCFICKPEGSSESQNTMEILLCSECTSNKSQSNDKVLLKAHPKKIQLSHVTTVLGHGNDLSSIKDSLNYPENGKELGYAAEGSSVDAEQERDASASRHALEDMSGTLLPIPYYEAKMQSEPCSKVKYQTDNLDQAGFSDNMDSSKEMFNSIQTDLNISFPTMCTVKDAAVLHNVMEVEPVQCPTILKCNEEKMDYNPQKVDSKINSLYSTSECSNACQSADADSKLLFAMPKQYDWSQDGTELNGSTSSRSDDSKCTYLQSGYEGTSEHLNSDPCSDGRTQEDNLVQQNTSTYKNVLQTNEGECLHHYESATCTNEEEYTNLKSTDNLSHNRSCSIKSDTTQDVTIDYPNKNEQLQDEDKECTVENNVVDSEMLELLSNKTCSGESIEDKPYQPTCCRTTSLYDMSDEVNGEHNTAMTANVSNCITNEKACKLEYELKPLCDQSMPLLACSNTLKDRVTSADDGNAFSVSMENKGEENCLSTGVCGEYSPDLSESTDISSSDTDTSRYLVLKNVPGLQNRLAECESYSPMSKNVNEISPTSHFNEEMSLCTDSIETPSPEHPNFLDEIDSTEPNMKELSIDQTAAVSINPSDVGTSPSRSNFDEKCMAEHIPSKIKSEVHAQHSMTDFSTQTVEVPCPTTINSELMEDVGGRAFLIGKLPDEHLNNLIPEPSHQTEQSTAVVDNTEGLHFSSSDINPFVHSWQQEDNPKPGWRNCTFNSAGDVSCAKVREQADKLIRCSSVDEGLNSHNSPFHSHLSSYANAKMVSSTISSLGRNDSRPDITSLDDSQELLSDESAFICAGNSSEFTGISGLQTKFEDQSQLDEIIFLYTSESETCNEPINRVSSAQGTQIKQKLRKSSKHQKNYTDRSSKPMQNRNVCQRPASWSNVQNMSLHLSQLLQETSELLGNLSKHNPENFSKDTMKIQNDSEAQIRKRSVRDSCTQTSVNRGVQTDLQTVNHTQNYTAEHNPFLSSPGINVIVKVLGTDSLTHIPQSNSLTEQNGSKVTKTRTQSLPNLNEIESCKQPERVLYNSPQVRASTPFLTGLQDMASIALPGCSSKGSSVSINVNRCSEDTIVNSPSSSVAETTKYPTSYEKTAMVDRASSPILTVKVSKKFHHKLVPNNHESQNFAKILRARKRKERELRDLQRNSSQTETDNESNAGNKYEAARSSSLRDTRKRVSAAKFQRFVSEGCILGDASSSFTNHLSSHSEITGSGKRCTSTNYFTSAHREKGSHSWEHLQSLQNISLSQPLANRDGLIPKQSAKEIDRDSNDFGGFTITSGNSYIKSRSYPYSPSQMSGLGLHLEEDGLSVVESECNTDHLLGQEPTFRTSQKPHSYALQDLPMHNKFSNWSGVQCSATKIGRVSSSPDLHIRGSPTKSEASLGVLENRSQEIERLQRERAEVLSAIHLEMNALPLTVQLAEAKLTYGIGETDALLRVLHTGKVDLQDAASIKKQLYERHLKVIENLRKEREERLQIFRRSRSLSPQKHLSGSQLSLISLKESDLPSRRREYLQQLRRDVVDNTRIQEPKSRTQQCPSEIEVMLKDYQKAREEAKTEIAKARDKLRERAEMERRRLQHGSLSTEDTKMKTLVSTSTLFTNSSLSLSSGPTSGYNSGMTATIGQCSKLGSQETLPRNLDSALGSGRGRSAVRKCDLFSPANISVPDPQRTSFTPAVESLPGKSTPYSPQSDSFLQPSGVVYQELATQVQASAMAEVMSACSYDLKKLYNRQAAAGWIYQTTEKDVLVYYKAYASPTKHGFIGAGVISRPLPDVWCMVKDVSTRHLYDPSILTADVHERLGSNIQLVHVMTDTSLCYLKQPRDFCCMAVEFKQEKCHSLCFQSVYNESMPRPSKDTIRGELMPSAWILQPDTIDGETITRVIYMIQVDLGAPAIPSRLLSVISKRQPLVIANLASFLSR